VIVRRQLKRRYVLTILVDRGANALFAINDPYFSSLRGQIVALAARNALPAVYFSRDFPPRAD
jgi:hypothetical protein